MYQAYVTRASEFGKPELDNTPLITQILKLHHEAARLLGYANHAEVSLVPKMAQTPQQVLDFLNDLAAKALPFARKDYAELCEFAAVELGLAPLEAWDLAFASEQLRAARYAFSDQEVKQYFPEAKVIQGMFRVVQTIFGVRIEPDQAETWDPTVRFFRVSDSQGNLVGQFYLDPYARDTKRGGAWMDEAISRRRRGTRVQTPVAYLTCNFSAPVGGKPALFTHDEVLTLFHEFGHGLHGMLSDVTYPSLSGTSVFTDFVELPSQLYEHWQEQPQVLRQFARHYQTGEPIPAALVERVRKTKTFNEGYATTEYLAAALLVEPARHRVDHGLGHVRDHGETTGHVSIDRAVAHGQLRLVAGGEQ